LRHAFPAGGTPSGGAGCTQRPSRAPLRTFVAVVLAGQVLGGALAAAILLGRSTASAATLGQAVPTSFGVLSVDQVETIPASNPDRDTLVAGLAEVQVAFTMTNLLSHPIDYARRQVQLRVVGSPTAIPVASGSVFAGRLAPRSAFRIIYRFDIPVAAKHLWLQFHDAARRAPVRVDLGSAPFPVGVSSAYNPKLHSYSPHGYGGGR
jgi:hypothetical protein